MPTLGYKHRAIAISALIVAILVVGPLLVTVDASGLSNGWTMLPTPQVTNTYYNEVPMTVSYNIIGGGNPTPPSFSYQQNGAPKVLILKTTSQTVLVDVGSTWSVSPNPLAGSTNMEQWFTIMATSGKISGPTSRTFTYRHQFFLTMAASPSNGGTVFPSSGFLNAGTIVVITAIPKSGFVFLRWDGTGTGSFSGPGTIHAVTMNSPISETGNFVRPLTVTLLSPSNGATVASSPVKFTVRVTSFGSPVSGASVSVFVDNNAVCTGLLTNASGTVICNAALTKTYSNTRMWFATASKAGFQDGTSQTFHFKF